MNENQRKWLQELHSKGIKFDLYNEDGTIFSRHGNNYSFRAPVENYHFPAQPVPDIPDWREVCRDMHSKGVSFKFLWGSMWENPGADLTFTKERDRYQIPAQPLPEWREDMKDFYAGKLINPEYKKSQKELSNQAKAIAAAIEEKIMSEAQPEAKQEKLEVPHRDLQIQWHEDKLHSLRTGEPMREWEVKDYAGDWQTITDFSVHPSFGRGEYRRKPRMKKVTYWHCTVRWKGTNAGIMSGYDKNRFEIEVNKMKAEDRNETIGPIVETTVEMPED